MTARLPQPETIADVDFVLRMDRACDEFERDWLRGEKRLIEVVIESFETHERDEVLRELVRLERELRLNDGERVERGEYEVRFPSLSLATMFETREAVSQERAAAGAKAFPSVPGYEILERIGRGGMGVVHKARHLKLNRLVALKMIDGALPSEEQLARFQAEAEAVALLQHPHIVQIHEVGESDGRPFLALEFVEGQTLSRRLAGEPQPPVMAARLIELLARAMQVAHERGVVHRDLKPSNILLSAAASGSSRSDDSRTATSLPTSRTPESNERTSSTTKRLTAVLPMDVTTLYGSPKITDFGLAKRLDTDSDLTVTGAILGTPGYMAPEQAGGNTKSLGPAVDVYSLGAIFYEMLTGRPPFKAPTSLETLELVRNAEPVAPTRLQPRIPRDLETICLKCLRKEPEARFASMAELAEELQRFFAGRPILTRPASLVERSIKLAQRHPTAASLIVLSVLMLFVLTGVWINFTQQLASERKDADAARISAEDSSKKARLSANDAVSARNDAESARDEALKAKERARASSYAASIQLAHRAWNDGDIPRMTAILDGPECLPSAGEPDLRHWEWHYLSSLRSTELKSLTCEFVPGPNPLAEGFTRGFHSACFTPDGTRVVATDWLSGRRVHVFDVASGQVVQSLDEHLDSVMGTVFSPDGKLCVTIGRHTAFTIIRDGHSFTPKHFLTQTDHVYGACFSNDSKLLFTACWDGKVHVWDVQTGKQTCEWFATQYGVLNVKLSPDGRRLATCGRGGSVKLWRPHPDGPQHPWVEECQFLGHRFQVTGLAFSPDGNVLATSSEDHEIKFWNVPEQRLIGTVRTHQKWVYHVAFSPDGQLLAACSDDKTVSLIDTETQRVVRRLRGHTQVVRDVAFSPNGMLLATTGLDRQIKIWDLTRPAHELDEFDAQKVRRSDIKMLPDGRHFVTGDLLGNVMLWDLGSRMSLRTVSTGTTEIHGLAVSPDSKWVAASIDSQKQPSITLIDTQSWKVAARLPGHHGLVRCLEFSPDSRQLLSASDDRSVKLWDVESQRLLTSFDDLVGYAAFARWMPDGGRALIGGSKEDVLLLDLTEKTVLQRFDGHEQGSWMSIVFDGGRRAATHYRGTQIRIWNLDAGKIEHTLPAHGAQLAKMAVSDDGRRLFSASYDNTVRIWDLQNGSELMTLAPDNEIHYSIAYASRSRALIDSNAAGDLRVWQPRSREDALAARSPLPVANWYEARFRECVAKGKGQAALWHLEQLAFADPEHSLLHQWEAEAAARCRDWPRALRAIETELARQPAFTTLRLNEFARPLLHRGALCARMAGDDARFRRFADVVFEQFVVKGSSPDCNSAAWLCAFGPMTGEFADRAVRVAEEAVALQSSAATLNTLGTVYLAAGRNADAIKTIERAMQATPDKSGTFFDWYVLAIAQQRLGNERAAREWLDKARRAAGRFGTSQSSDIRVRGAIWEDVEVEAFDEWARREVR